MPLFAPEPGFTEGQRKKLVDIGGETFAVDLEFLSDARTAGSWEYLTRSPGLYDTRKPSRIRRSDPSYVPERGRRGFARRWLGDQVRRVFENHEIDISSSRAGDFVEALDIILDATGAKTSDVATHAHRLAQDILK